jgi:hypothetical protein
MEMKHAISLWLVLFTIFLTACAPHMVTEYQIVPPQSESGRFCANNCLMMKDNCEQNCWAQQQDCESQKRMEGHIDYLTYLASRNGKPVKKTPSDFRGSGWCDDSGCQARCTQNYNICHTNCGGQVIPHTYCSAFCE